MDATREAGELVRLWQELQRAQVAGDTRRLDELRRLAESRAQRPDASGEWSLLAREAGRQTEGLREEVEAQPTVGVAEAGAAPAELDEISVPDAAREPAEEAEDGGRGFRLGPLVWVVIVAIYLLIQLLGNAGEEGLL